MTIWNMEITAAESPQTVHIPLEGKYYAIKNTGEHDILVSSSVTNPTEGEDDVMKIPSGSAAIIPVKDGDLYVSAEEDGTYSVSIQDDKVLPWSGGTGSGGGGGDNTHYKGTTTTPLENGSTTNPIVIDGESYTAVFGDVVVYGYTEFVFDGTAWSEFGRPFDTVPTQGSTNAVTSDGIYKVTPWIRGSGGLGIQGGDRSTATRSNSLAYGSVVSATGLASVAFGSGTSANQAYMFACGSYNSPRTNDLFNIGIGAGPMYRSNIVEVNYTSMNVNGDIKVNNVSIPTPYTTMPTITANMLGQIAMYVGATDANYTKGRFYIASSDGAAEPTYYWQPVDKPAYTLTTLWEYDGVDHIDTVGTVICSEAELAEYDFVGMLYGFRQMPTGDVFGQYSFAPTKAMPQGLISIASFATSGGSYYNGRIGISNGDLKIVGVANNTYVERDITYRMGIYKVVAIKFGVSDAALARGRTETVLWENEGTTNPETITLSEAWSNFDELAIVTVDASGGSSYETAKHTSVMAIGSLYTLWYNSESTWGTYHATSSTVFTKFSAGGDYHIAKVIGIKY